MLAVLDLVEIPESISSRLISARAYDADGMMLDADVVEGTVLATLIRQMFGNRRTAFIHLHNAKQGCYAARVERA